jgi:carboxyl-terminal processing protease
MFDSDEIGESHLDSALPWDQIHSVPHQYSDQINKLVKPLTIAHKKRAYTDANFSSMTDQLTLRQGWKNEKQANLNLEQRKKRDNRIDESLLAIENNRRLSNKLEAYADMEAWEKAKDDEDNKDKNYTPTAENDPMLYETGLILSDQIRLLKHQITTKITAK